MTSRKLEIIAEPGKLSFTTRRVVDAPRALVLDESDGKTTITTTTLHKTVEARDGHVRSGMEAGMTEGYARLDELLAALQNR